MPVWARRRTPPRRTSLAMTPCCSTPRPRRHPARGRCGKHVDLGEGDVGGADVKVICDAGLTLGLSTHDDAELETALRAQPDYIALGPILPTTLKSMRFAPQGIPKITEWKQRIGNIPLVAIGGIKPEQAAEIFAAGADSIAVVSDVTRSADPDARVRAWLGQNAEAA